MLINKSHKISTNVSFHIRTIWGVEPNDLSLSRLTFRLAWDILNGFIVSTIFNSDIVTRGCFIEMIFITRALFLHLPIEFTTVLVKILLKSVTTTIHVLSEINLVK